MVHQWCTVQGGAVGNVLDQDGPGESGAVFLPTSFVLSLPTRLSVF
jgi:hypothetical protein